MVLDLLIKKCKLPPWEFGAYALRSWSSIKPYSSHLPSFLSLTICRQTGQLTVPDVINPPVGETREEEGYPSIVKPRSDIWHRAGAHRTKRTSVFRLTNGKANWPFSQKDKALLPLTHGLMSHPSSQLHLQSRAWNQAWEGIGREERTESFISKHGYWEWTEGRKEGWRGGGWPNRQQQHCSHWGKRK
jgi:hypothetical protein